MKVSIVNFYGKGGMLYYAVALANALAAKCDVTLALPRKPQRAYRGISSGVRLLEVMVPEDFTRRNIMKTPLYAALYPMLVAQIRGERPDIVHFTNENIWLVGLLPFLNRQRLVWTLHDPIPHLGDSLRKKISTRILGRCSARIFVHYQYNLAMAAQNGFEAKKLVAIPHGAYDFYEKYLKPGVQQRRMFLFWGRIRPYKGIDTLIHAAKFLPQDVEIVIAGEGAGKYRDAAGDDGRIVLMDKFLADEEIAELCQQSMAVVTPYVEATQSGIVSVAYACSRPVIATKVGALPEQVEDHRTGLLVEPQNPRELADAMMKILENPSWAQSMGAAGYRKNKTDMSWESVAHTVYSVYEEIVGLDFEAAG
ncbi:MAG: glycosyltransferase family 4 protein [Desulfomonilaceae bacterium]